MVAEALERSRGGQVLLSLVLNILNILCIKSVDLKDFCFFVCIASFELRQRLCIKADTRHTEDSKVLKIAQAIILHTFTYNYTYVQAIGSLTLR